MGFLIGLVVFIGIPIITYLVLIYETATVDMWGTRIKKYTNGQLVLLFLFACIPFINMVTLAFITIIYIGESVYYFIIRNTDIQEWWNRKYEKEEEYD